MSETISKRAMGDLLAVGFGTNTAIWALVYIGLTIGGAVGIPLVVLMLLTLFAGGWVLGRFTNRGPMGGVWVGLINGTLNLLILSSLLGGDKPNEILVSMLGWIAGYMVISMILAALGVMVGGKRRSPACDCVNWTALFAAVAAITTGILIVAGGVVTSLEAGLAVPDWPNTFGYPMIFYPLSMMQEDGNVYAEHAHRLWGTLVGFTAIVLTIHVWIADSRKWLRWIVAGILLAIVVQGIMGGLRVTATNTALALIHGVFGQLVFVLLAGVAVCASATWINATEKHASRLARGTRKMSLALVIVLIIQLMLGAGLRHYGHGLYPHMSFAFIPLFLGVLLGFRVRSSHTEFPVLPRNGLILLILVKIQVLLGFAAWIATSHGQDTPPLADVIVSTIHQANGAAVLAFSFMLMLFAHRLLSSEVITDPDR